MNPQHISLYRTYTVCNQLVAGCLLVLSFLVGTHTAAMAGQDTVQVRVYRLTMDDTTNQPMVFLSDEQENRAMVILIGIYEAIAIYSEMNQIEHKRPLTHELLKQMIEQLGGQIHRIVITEVKDNTYYAAIVVKKDASMIEIDARPSDSIVMALKFNVPIYVDRSLFEQTSLSIGGPPTEKSDYGLTLQNITPPLAEYLAYDSTQGAMVANIRPGSRAEKDGLRPSDIIVAINNKKINHADAAQKALYQRQGPVKARVYRANQYLELKLHPTPE
jgi:bifunctional DNase/RNase